MVPSVRRNASAGSIMVSARPARVRRVRMFASNSIASASSPIRAWAGAAAHRRDGSISATATIAPPAISLLSA